MFLIKLFNNNNKSYLLQSWLSAGTNKTSTENTVFQVQRLFCIVLIHYLEFL